MPAKAERLEKDRRDGDEVASIFGGPETRGRASG